ncbi:formiminoglutamase [Caldalkalibacillus uzonensis]|uniref:Formiminoglutamase n=1 Tax=Caldalkalibacillus uzonensis TaxID=353224 RepID=A0ABU0CXG3_9BACI|nr:agmatinase family protein [Caldalkalibacillus uzonensis]MDQ0340007.1 formiminoglutamase [Caldalkalibacillus uzonensis]
MTYPYPQLNPPPFRWMARNTTEPKVHEWIRTIDPEQAAEYDWSQVDVTIVGIPLSRSSISASAASENPEAMRQAWKSFVPYSIDEDVDLTPLHVVDVGDVRQHVTDIPYCHRQIKEAMISMRRTHPHALPIMLGGDHSVTAMLVKGWKEAHPEQRIGLLQFDTHFDLRSVVELGPANGTPVRQLIESGTVRGEDVWNIGLHGYFNALSLKKYADEHGVNYVTLKKARQQGLQATLQEALADLERKVDVIYLTVDMDVLDMADAPGAPAATPGGMRTDELFELVLQAGQHDKVQAMDIVCLDPHKDVRQVTVKAGVYVMLTFLTGFMLRKQHNRI